ncbi:MAG TPA: amidase family protein [Micromonosporaceae bacterium]
MAKPPLADPMSSWDPSVWRVRGEPLLGPTTGPTAPTVDRTIGPTDDATEGETSSAFGGSLAGLSVAVKDLFAVGGHPVGAGNPDWLAEATPAPADAAAVALLRRAGARIRGIAQTDELAYSLSGVNAHYGAPPNPAAPDRVTGGSSNGPAAAVALGEADIGLGTDTAGSVRVPASACGLYGLRPTHGAVPADGVVPLSVSFDTVGWLTRDASTLRAVGQVLLPPATGSPDRLARLLLPEPFFAGVESAGVVRDAAARLARALSLRVEGDQAWPGEQPELIRAFGAAQAVEAWRQQGPWIEAHPGSLSPDTEARFRFGAGVTQAEESQARDVIRRWRDEVLAMLGTDTWLALPAAAGPAHLRRADPEQVRAWRRATLRCTVLASACGLPSVVLPTRSPAGAPLGLALVAPPGADHHLLDAVATVSTIDVLS